MARYKDANWNLTEPIKTWDEASIAVLMDIRDELKSMNQILHCSNTLRIPWELGEIRKTLQREQRLRATERRKGEASR